MQLVIARPSPFARKVRIALREKDIAYDEVMDVPWNPDTKASGLNPLGKIPILILESGNTIFDSSVICEYLETLDHAPRLIPDGPRDRVAVRQIETLADGISDAVVLIVIENNRRPDLISRDWLIRQHAKIEAGLAALNAAIAGKDWMIGDAMTLADITVGCALKYLDARMPDVQWRDDYPALVAFSEKMEARPSFQATRPEPQEILPLN